nr:MAG TPA: hypothetical protein [Caudoviricetes sp.]
MIFKKEVVPLQRQINVLFVLTSNYKLSFLITNFDRRQLNLPAVFFFKPIYLCTFAV